MYRCINYIGLVSVVHVVHNFITLNVKCTFTTVFTQNDPFHTFGDVIMSSASFDEFVASLATKSVNI